MSSICHDAELLELPQHDNGDVWKCCSCGASNLEANADTLCPVCGHRRCSHCEDGLGVQGHAAPLERKSDWSLEKFLAMLPKSPNGAAPSGTHNCTVAHVTVMMVHDTMYSNANPQYRTCPASLNSSNQQQMSGWWYCHTYNHLNNPALAGERCSQCNHVKCVRCSVIP